jgi:hypothetical protein
MVSVKSEWKSKRLPAGQPLFYIRHAGAICAFILKRFLNLNRLSLRVENAV